MPPGETFHCTYLIPVGMSLRARIEHVRQHEALSGYGRGHCRDGQSLLVGRLDRRLQVERRLGGSGNFETCALCQFGHQLQTPRGAQIDSGSVHLVAIQRRVTAREMLCYVIDFHGPSGQLEAVQLLHGFLCVLSVAELKYDSHYTKSSTC